MADAPDQLTLKRHRDLVGRERRPLVRRTGLAGLGLPLPLVCARARAARRDGAAPPLQRTAELALPLGLHDELALTLKPPAATRADRAAGDEAAQILSRLDVATAPAPPPP